jgi:hypothetical protein
MEIIVSAWYFFYYQKYDVLESLGAPERVVNWMTATLGSEAVPCVSILLILVPFLLMSY